MTDVVPRPNTFGARLARIGLWVLGRWKFVPSPPPPDKAVLLAVPHSTNMDGLLLVLVARSIGLKMSWMVKDFWVKRPYGWLTKPVGAVGVDRSQATGMVGQMVDRFNSSDEFHLVIPPEGSRSRSEHWKSGFYRIALEAGVPVVPTFLDFRNKRAGFGEAIELTGDRSEDMDRLRAFYDELGGATMAKYPDQVGPIRLDDES